MTSADVAGAPCRFYVRTYGCQMNEHDSERLAGLLAADGMESTGDLEAADVVVLNTCCIRENADNKLYGHLGRLKALKAAKPGLQIAVGGCLAQKDRELVVERAGHVDVVFGTHNLGRGVLLTRPAGRRAVVEIRRRRRGGSDHVPARTSTTGRLGVGHHPVGFDNPALSSSCPCARQGSQPADGRHRPRGRGVAPTAYARSHLGQNVTPTGRDLGAGQYRPQFADLLHTLDAVDGVDRIRFTSPHPKDLRPETIAAIAECASVCGHRTSRCSQEAIARSPACTMATPPSAICTLAAAARDAIPDLAVTTDLIVGFPGETDDDFARNHEVVDAGGVRRHVHVRALAASGHARGGDDRRLRRPRGRAERMDRLAEVVERHALAKHGPVVGLE